MSNYFKTRRSNNLEVQFAKERDRTERHGLITAQLRERQELQSKIKTARRREAEQVLALYRDAAKFCRLKEQSRGGREQAPARVRDKGLDLG
jgi:hypothetical protein